jgi:hypothetical protein
MLRNELHIERTEMKGNSQTFLTLMGGGSKPQSSLTIFADKPPC